MNKAKKTGLLLALFFLFISNLKGQSYFNRLYNNGIGTYSVLSLDEGYFLPTQIQPGNTVGIATIQTDFLGTITGGDTTTVLGYGLFPRLPSSSKRINKNVFFLGVLQSTSTDFNGVLLKYDSEINKEINRYKYQDSISIFFSSMVVNKENYLTITGLAQKYTGGLNEYQSQLLLMQLDTLGNKLWERSFAAKQGLLHLQGNSIIVTQDGGYAVGCFAYNNGTWDGTASYILVTDSLGNKLNERYIENSDHDNSGLLVVQKPNGNFLVSYARGYFSKDPQNWRERSYYLAVEELDKNTLQTVWKKEYLPGYINLRTPHRLISHNDSTYLICGTYRPDYILYQGNFAAQLGYIFAINAQGDSLWYRDYNNGTDSSEYNYLNDIAVTPDGGIVGTGRLQTPKSPYTGGLANHVWLFKTDSIGCLYAGCDTVYAKPKPPVTEFKVYPNPLQNGQDLIIELPGAESATATLYNSIGQIVLKSELEFVSGTATLQLGKHWVGAATGVYYLVLATNQGKHYSQKLVLCK